MRYSDFKIINEATLTIADFARRNPEYWVNLIDIIDQGAPVPIDNGEVSVEIENPENVASQMRDIWDGADVATPEQVELIKKIRIPTVDGTKIPVGRIYKSPAIKGKEADYNIGDIGEIALGISTGARFKKAGQPIDINDFLALANSIKVSPIKGKQSLQMRVTDNISYDSGKNDELTIDIVVPARSAKSFSDFINDLGSAPKNVQGTISSSLEFANNNENITNGVNRTASDPNTNRIEVAAIGTQDQKGTKADLVLNIDGERINLLSAKAGASQLGQASGKEWDKPLNFFMKVFGEDVSAYKSGWSADQPKNLEVLRAIYKDVIIPKVMRLTGGDSVQKEKALVKQIVQGLVHFANDTDNETGEAQIIDIVKLSTVPGSPGYKLMRIDSSLEQALEKVDLVGTPTPNGLGVQVYADTFGKNVLLFKARSYYSPAGKLTRTIIEGGPLLDALATVSKPGLSKAYLQQLKAQFGNLPTLNPADKNNLNKLIRNSTPLDLRDLSGANIKWVSDAAANEISRRGLD
jgi:hypothetical protein